MFEYIGKDRRRLRNGTRPFSRAIDVGQARVFIDHGFQWDGTQNVWLTRARASFVLGAGPVFDIRPRALLARLTGIFCGVSSGDPYFDDFFALRTTDLLGTCSALTTRVRSLLAGPFEDARLQSDGKMVTLWREGEFGLESDAEMAAETVAEIAHYDSEVLAELERLPGAVFCPPLGRWDKRTWPSVRLTRFAPLDVFAGPCAGDTKPVMSTWVDCGKARPTFCASFREDGLLLSDPDFLPPEIRTVAERLPDLGACELRADGHRITLRWEELSVSQQRLIHGTQVVAALGRLPSPMYR